jgi:DNA invertase Pin-like site-specific DNA recombinase
MSKLLLSMMGAFTEFERSLILERQREGIAIAISEGKYKSRKPALSSERAAELKKRISTGEKKVGLAREFGSAGRRSTDTSKFLYEGANQAE